MESRCHSNAPELIARDVAEDRCRQRCSAAWLISLATTLASAIALAACSGAGNRAGVERAASDGEPLARSRDGRGAPDGRGDRSQGAAVGAEPGGVWELAGKLSSLRKATPRSLSQHMNGDLEAEVLASDEAKAYPTLGPARPLPPGAVLVDAHYRPASADPIVFFVMAKRPPGFDPNGGDWEYLIVEPGGAISQRGRLALCSRCHAEAPFDHVFGRAR